MLRTSSAAALAAFWLALASASSSIDVAAAAKANRSTKAKMNMHGILNKQDIPDSGRDWISFPDGTEFQPGKDNDPRLENLRRHLGYTTNNGVAMAQPYIDGGETYYDEYAQAWRALGWYIDCNGCGDGDNNNDQGGNGMGGCVGANYYGDDGGNDNNDERSGCKRYLMWAAYVDLDYEGYRVHEYKYYDRKSNSWSDNACQNVANLYLDDDGEDNEADEDDGNSYTSNLTLEYGKARCVKMDCHLSNTHYKLLGIFKEPNYDEWMEQLFKHEGDCLWDDEEYEFMQSDREAWPNGCTESATHVTNDGGLIYYDLKPLEYGGMDIGLYTDELCIEEYTGSFTVEEVLQAAGYSNYNGGGDDGNSNSVLTLAEELQAWNDAFDVYKQCQPCKTYLLTHIVAGLGSEYNVTGNRNQAYEDWDDNDNDDDDNENFHCNDDAGYDNVNQCMKFKTKTQMLTAAFTDVMAAAEQGTITKVHVETGKKTAHLGYDPPVKYTVPGTDQSYARGILFSFALFLLSIGALAFGYGSYKGATKRSYDQRVMNSPLIS